MNMFQEEKCGGKPRLMRSNELPSWIIKDDAEVGECRQLAFLTLCDLALNPPFLGGKMIELGKFCFIKTKCEPNLSCFSK